MFVLHRIGGRFSDLGLGHDVVSIAMLNPHPPAGSLLGYDFGIAMVVDIDPSSVLSAASADPPAASFAPSLSVEHEQHKLAANRAQVLRLSRRRKRAEVATSFVSGYTSYARDAALFWREQGVGTQPLLAAGVFSLSTIQTSIVSALRLFSALTPFVIGDKLPSALRLGRIVRESGAGLDDPATGRPSWYKQYEDWRERAAAAIASGTRDDALRWQLAVTDTLPRGLGLAKLSFTLALVGNNLGCLDARIVDWAFTPAGAERFHSRVRKTKRGSYSRSAYLAYRRAEIEILKDTPFYDPDDPVALARSQWMLWESLGPEQERSHSHEELYRAVVDGRIF